MPLGEVIQLEYGKALPAKDRKDDGRYPVYGANGEKARSDRFYFGKPSIIVGRKGSAGEVNMTDGPFWPLDVTYFVTFDEQQHDLRFLYYLLKALDLPKLAKGVKPGINRADSYSQVVRIPPRIEQERVAQLLDAVFDGTATARSNVERSLSLARGLVDGHRNAVFVENGKGWVTKYLNEIALNLDSRRVPITKRDRTAGEYPYYGASGIVDYVDDFIFEGDALLVSEDGANLLARSTPIAFSVSGKYWVNNHAHVLKFENSRPSGLWSSTSRAPVWTNMSEGQPSPSSPKERSTRSLS
jgi:type I restriction enzyme S subunit